MASPRARTWTLVVAGALLLAGCLDTDLVECDGLVCPPGTRCAAAGGCALAAQLDACGGREPGDACAYAGVTDGVCRVDVCVASGCGNGVVEAGEVCDDGGQELGDGCAADCGSDETCGNGVPDQLVGEACDCGAGPVPRAGCAEPNSLAPGAECRPDCTLGRCGDDVLEVPEECEGGDLGGATCADLGYYAGDLGCTATCRFDVETCDGRCGDDELNGGELCDGAAPPGVTCTAYGYGMGSLGCVACGLSFTRCVPIGWRPETTPYASLHALRAAGGSLWASLDDLAPGVTRTLVRWDGARWDALPAPPDDYMLGYWPLDGERVVAVEYGNFLTFDGAAWSKVSIPTDGASFDTIWAASEDELVVAGSGLVRWDGSAWTELLDGTWHVNQPWGDGAGAVWASIDDDLGTVYRCVGGTCTAHAPTGERIHAVSGSGPDDVWVGDVRGGVAQWDGTSWRVRRAGAVDDWLEALWVGGPRDVYASTTDGVQHWDGSAWARALAGSPVSGLFPTVLGVGSERYAAGQGRLWHATGAFWATSDDALLGVIGEAVWTMGDGVVRRDDEPTTLAAGILYGVAGRTADDIWAFGQPGRVEHWDGETWTDRSPLNPFSASIPYAMAVAADGTAYLGESEGLWRHDGAWTRFDLYNVGEVAVVGSEVLAIGNRPGENARLFRVVGDALVEVAVGFAPDDLPGGLWARADDDLWVSTVQGWLHRWDGATWSAEEIGAGNALGALGGTSPSDVFVSAGAGTLRFWDGGGWSTVDLPQTGNGGGRVWVMPTRVYVGPELRRLVRLAP